MVNVSLLKLVCIPGSQNAWPDDFRALIGNLEEMFQPAQKRAKRRAGDDDEDDDEPGNANQRKQLAALADWCEEHDEPELSNAFKWLLARPEVGFAYSTRRRAMTDGERSWQTHQNYWEFNGRSKIIDTALAVIRDQGGTDDTTIAGLVAHLAAALEWIKDQLKTGG